MAGLFDADEGHTLTSVPTSTTAKCEVCGAVLTKYIQVYDGQAPYTQWFSTEEIVTNQQDTCEHQVEV